MRARITSVLKKFGRKQQSWWSVVAAVVFLVVASVFVYSPSVIPPPPADAQGANPPNMSGWAWSSNIGWISASCANITPGCTTGGIALEPVANGKRLITGYAWNEKIGWIKFNPGTNNGLYPYPTGVNTVATDAYFDNVNRVLGWARACNVFVSNCTGALKSDSQRGGWDGWISLGRTDSVAGGAGNTQNPYGVRVTSGIVNGQTKLAFNDFAWGQTILGWVDFNPRTGYGVTCCTDDTTLTINISGAGLAQVKRQMGVLPAVSDPILCDKTSSTDPNKICTITRAALGGSNIALYAVAGTNTRFVGWLGACTGTSFGCSVDISSSNKSVTVSIDSGGGTPPSTLDLVATPPSFGSGGGTTKLTWTSTRVVDGTCDQSGGWTAQNQSNNNSSGVDINVSQNTTFTLTCDKQGGGTIADSVTVTVGGGPSDPSDRLKVNVSGNGEVTSDDLGINGCIEGGSTAACSESYSSDRNVTLTATPDPDNGATFEGWTGDIPNQCVTQTGQNPPLTCTVFVNQDRDVTATFSGGGTPPPCLVQGVGGVQGLGSNTLTVDLGGRSGAFINSTGMLMEMLTSFAGVNVSISTNSLEINNFDSSLLYTDQELCVHGAATAPGLSCLGTETTNLLQGTKKNRTLWLKVPHTGKDNQLDPSVYMGCNNANILNGSARGCKVTVTIDPTSGTSCDHSGPDTSVTLDYFVKFRDSSISPQGAGN